MSVQWNFTVGVAKVFGVKNLSIHQWPLSTETIAIHWSSHDTLSELGSTKEQNNSEILSNELMSVSEGYSPESCFLQDHWSMQHQSLPHSGSHWDTHFSLCPLELTVPVHKNNTVQMFGIQFHFIYMAPIPHKNHLMMLNMYSQSRPNPLIIHILYYYCSNTLRFILFGWKCH